jgi:transposase
MTTADRELSQEEERARRRAELIIQVQAGRMSAAAAAAQMGVSRKTYYKWEQRGLSAILSSLREGKRGRPAEPVDKEKACLIQEVKELREQVQVQEQIQRVRAVLQESSPVESSLSATKKKGRA